MGFTVSYGLGKEWTLLEKKEKTYKMTSSEKREGAGLLRGGRGQGTTANLPVWLCVPEEGTGSHLLL